MRVDKVGANQLTDGEYGEGELPERPDVVHGGNPPVDATQTVALIAITVTAVAQSAVGLIVFRQRVSVRSAIGLWHQP